MTPPPPFGTFPKIHPIWYCDPSLCLEREIPSTLGSGRKFTFPQSINMSLKVWVLGGFNETYDWQAGEEGFLSSTEVNRVIVFLVMVNMNTSSKFCNFTTIQIFSLSTQTWRQGPELPYGVNWGQVYTLIDSPIYTL